MAYTLKETRYTKYAISGTSTPNPNGDLRSYVRTYYDQTTDDKINNRSRLKLVAGIQITGTSQLLDGSALTTKINGTTKISYTVRGTYSIGTHDLKTVSDVLVSHDSEGNGSYTISHTCFGKSFQATLSLPKIARQSTITLTATNPELGNEITIKIARNQSAYTHKLYYKFGSSSVVQIATDVGTSYSFTPSVEVFAPLLTNASSGICTIYCDTFNGSTQIGSRTSATITLTIPTTIKPTISLVLSEGNPTVVPSEWNCYVKSKSKIAGTITGFGVYGSTISSYYATANNSKYYASFVTDLLSTAGLNNIYAKVTDTRSRSEETNQSINVVDYFEPTISYCKVERCRPDGTTSSSGTCIKVITSYSIAPINNGTRDCNTKSLVIKYRMKGLYDPYNQIVVPITKFSEEELVTIIDTSTFNASKIYELVVELSDYFKISYLDMTLSTSKKPISVYKKGNGVTFGRVATEAGLHSYFPSYFHDGLYVDDENSQNQINILNLINSLGVIVEQTTNSLGTYIKFSTGLMITYQEQEVNADVKNAWGSIFSSDPLTPSNFPESFADVPETIITKKMSIGLNFWIMQIESVTKNRAGAYQILRGTSATNVSATLSVIAIGMWKKGEE